MTPPRFIPFEAMTTAQQREHLRVAHGCTRDHDDQAALLMCHVSWPVSYQARFHIHDKRPEENR